MIYYCYINPFGADVLHTEKPGGWFAPTATEKSSQGVTFQGKISGVFQVFLP